MAALRNVRFHTGKDFQPVIQRQTVSLSAALSKQVSIQISKLQRIKMLRQAQRVQTGQLCLSKQPVRILCGKRQLLCQLAMSVKIKLQFLSFFLLLYC